MHQSQKFSLITLAFACALAQAQGLSDLYNEARKHDAGYLAARAQSEATVAKADQSNLLPTVSLAAVTSRSVVKPFPGTSNDRLYGTQSATLSASQPVYRPATLASYRQGQVLYEQARIQLSQAEQDLMIRISQAYFDVLASQDSLALVRAQKAANAEQLAAARRNFEVGTATITDTHEAQARFDLAQAQEIAAENDLSVKQLALSTIAGLPSITPKPLTGSAQLATPQPNDMHSWVNIAIENHPGILLAQMTLDTARLEVEKAAAGHKPTLDLTLSYGPVRNIGGTGSSALPTDTRYSAGSVGLNFNLPLYAGGATQGRVRETMALEDQARAALEAARRSATQATRAAFLGVQSGKSQIKALEAAEASSKSALEANTLGYQVGVRINIDVLNAQSQLFQTRRDLAKARYDLLISSLKLKQAAGILKPEDIDTVNQLIAK
jgi:outer membrane protein